MEYVYAALLLHKAGKPIDEKNITKILDSTGIKADSARVKALVASLEEVDIELRSMSPIMHEEIVRDEHKISYSISIEQAGNHRATEYITHLKEIGAKDFNIIFNDN